MIAKIRSGLSEEDHKRFFTEMLHDIDTPSYPYELSNVHGDGLDITESHIILPQELSDSLRSHSKSMGVSLATLFHIAWGIVISKTSGKEKCSIWNSSVWSNERRKWIRSSNGIIYQYITYSNRYQRDINTKYDIPNSIRFSKTTRT
jgi:hypothetical protein